MQSAERRPKVRPTRNHRAWAEEWRRARPIGNVADIKKAMRLATARWMMAAARMAQKHVDASTDKGRHKDLTAELARLRDGSVPTITRRTMRSFMATRVRAVKEITATISDAVIGEAFQLVAAFAATAARA